MIRTIITAITGGEREWVVVAHEHLACAVHKNDVLPQKMPELIVRRNLTYRAAMLLAARLRQQAEDRPEAVL